MTSKGQIHLREIRRMLRECAPGHIWDEKDHRIKVTHGDKIYWKLPTGHGSGGQIQRPHVKKLAQVLGILACAKGEIPSL